MHVSQSAAQTLHETLVQNAREESDVIRIAQTEDGLALALGKTMSDDETFDHQDRTVLAIGSDIASALEDTTLDTVEEEGGTRLVLRRD